MSVIARRIIPIIAHYRRKTSGQVVPVVGSVVVCKERFLQASVEDELFNQARLCKEQFNQASFTSERLI